MTMYKKQVQLVLVLEWDLNQERGSKMDWSRHLAFEWETFAIPEPAQMSGSSGLEGSMD
jgi:hypothetical protein